MTAQLKWMLGVLLLTSVESLAQSPTQLPPAYYIDNSKAVAGEPVRIRKYRAYDLYQRFNTDSVRKLSDQDQRTFTEQALASDPVTLKAGTYELDNDQVRSRFRIGEGGQLTGPMQVTDKRRGTEGEVLFENGIPVQSVIRKGSVVVGKSSLKDSVARVELYDRAGTLKTVQRISYKAGPGFRKIVSTHYGANGNISSVQDDAANTFVSYYPNGRKQEERDDPQGLYARYRADGKLERRQYRKGADTCDEDYANGFLETQTCITPRGVTHRYYQKGKLTRTEVYDRTTGKTTVLDATGKAIKQPSTSDKVPVYVPSARP